jgi:glycerol-3-phosphate acyltransferase PlsY
MTLQSKICMFALLVGFIAGLNFAIWYGAHTRVSMTWWYWFKHGGKDYTAFTYPVGAALAGWLAAWGAMRWRGPFATISVVSLSSLAGAVIAVPVSFALKLGEDGPRVSAQHELPGPGTGDWIVLLSLLYMPIAFALLAGMTTILAFLARSTIDRAPEGTM